jgi:hypothetical protein
MRTYCLTFIGWVSSFLVYNPLIDTAVWNDRVVASTGQRLEVKELSGGKLFMKPYLAVLDRVHGWLSLLKKLSR